MAYVTNWEYRRTQHWYIARLFPQSATIKVILNIGHISLQIHRKKIDLFISLEEVPVWLKKKAKCSNFTLYLGEKNPNLSSFVKQNSKCWANL